jgi:U3 small nucleolar RNA-associated protein 15
MPTLNTTFITGHNIVKVWDILAGGRLVAAFSNHQKTITSLCFDGQCTRLLSASLDRYSAYVTL